jgi:hypothetical protein
LYVRTFIRFIPLASETSIGAMDPMKRDGRKEETRETREVEAYASGKRRRSWRMAKRDRVNVGRLGSQF